MKNKIYLSFIFAFIFFISNAQSNYYYYSKGEKKYLTIDRKRVTIFVDSNFVSSSISNLNINDFTLKNENYNGIIENWAEIEFTTEPDDVTFIQKINTLKNNQNINGVEFCFKISETKSIGTSNLFYIKLKTLSDEPFLRQFASQHNVDVLKQDTFMPLWFMLKTTKNSTLNSIETANLFFETGMFAEIDPAFIFNFTMEELQWESLNSSATNNNCASDVFFDEQWGLKNNDDSSLDINACEAWNILPHPGLGIKVAIVDHGIFKLNSDLSANISPLSYDTTSASSPSVLNYNFDFSTGTYVIQNHGTHMAGIIGADKDQGKVVGVAPECELISISNTLTGSIFEISQLTDGINWAVSNGADVINNSWGLDTGWWSITQNNYITSPLLEAAIQNAITNGRNGKGSIVIFSGGNGGVASINYPGNSNPDILVIGGMNKQGKTGTNYGSELDLMAPGEDIISTISPIPHYNTYTVPGTFSSPAAAYVSGIAALVLSANPCLSGKQVRDIIEQTSQKVRPDIYTYLTTSNRTNGTWNNEMGYGLADAYAAVQMAQNMYSSSLDLMIKDNSDDIGLEPNTTTPYMWASPDIWIRHLNDNGLEHQNPEYDPITPNYAYIKITNKSCITSSGTETVKLYWAKAGSSLSWPGSWNGTQYFPQGPLMGDFVGEVTIPVLQGGEETIVSVDFPVPNPANYSFAGAEQWHFCLLARIEATTDPLNEGADLNTNVTNNNGIAWKNITVVNIEDNVTTGTIAVGNPSNAPRTFFIEMVKEDIETGKPIYEEAEVGIKMDDILYTAWQRGGENAQLLEATIDEKRKIVKGNNVILDNIAFNAKEVGFLTLDFSFLVDELTEKPKFRYHVIQKDAQTGAIIGGETYEIIKHSRNLFQAVANNQEADLNEAITISAQDINEPAIYNWYNSHGDLVFQGKELAIANAVAETYKLEVISTTDGFKDYTDVEVTLKPSSIDNISPNPATTTATINYKINDANTAYLMIIGYYGNNGIANNYILDTNIHQIDIDISTYTNGFYTVALVVNGEIIDAKTLIKQ